MNKKSVFGIIAILAITIFAAPINGQQDFSPLTSKCEGVNGLLLEVSSEVKIEKREKAPPVYVTAFAFANKGRVAVKFTFVDEDFSLYAALVWSLETDDFSVSLKPKEIKTIKIQTLKPPVVSRTNNFVSVWRQSSGGWDITCFTYSEIHIPIVFEPPTTSTTTPIPREPGRAGGKTR